MITTRNYESVKIHIIALKTDNQTMEDACKKSKNSNRFICSICLNSKPIETRQSHDNHKAKQSCPVCYKTCNCHKINKETELDSKFNQTNNDLSSKDVQTSEINLNEGLSLLNEVLTVFQTKKFDAPKVITTKQVARKDASVSTESLSKSLNNSNLSMSKVYKFSITDEKVRDHPKFVVLNACQPEMINTKLCLSKHKSSSIPQMKLEELKYSLKEKTKSKDAIEEVNRMFATVGKGYKESRDDSNRPLIRSGPRVLPVVKTNYKKEDTQNSCKCCQTSFCSPGGDSKTCVNDTRCGKCAYMSSCQGKHKLNPSYMICACCQREEVDCDFNDAA